MTMQTLDNILCKIDCSGQYIKHIKNITGVEIYGNIDENVKIRMQEATELFGVAQCYKSLDGFVEKIKDWASSNGVNWIDYINMNNAFPYSESMQKLDKEKFINRMPKESAVSTEKKSEDSINEVVGYLIDNIKQLIDILNRHELISNPLVKEAAEKLGGTIVTERN